MGPSFSVLATGASRYRRASSKPPLLDAATARQSSLPNCSLPDHAPGLASQDRHVTRRAIFNQRRHIGQRRQVQPLKHRQQVLDYIVRDNPLNLRADWQSPFQAEPQVGPRRGRRPLVQDQLEPPRAAMRKRRHGEHENPIGTALAEDFLPPPPRIGRTAPCRSGRPALRDTDASGGCTT